MNPLVQKFKDEKRWVNYQLTESKGKTTKIPYSTNGRMASSTDEKTWSTYDVAKRSSKNVGIMFGPTQTLLGIDIDHCLIDKKIKNELQETIGALILESDTYCEISPSGEGLHFFLEIDGTLPLTSNKKAPFEAYTSGRYFTVTENPYGEPRAVRKVAPDEALRILAIIGYPWKKVVSEQPLIKQESTPVNDSDVLKMMFRSKNGADIKALYNGDISAYKDDASSADMALCSHLAFWTGKDAAQIQKLWLESPLGSREKTQKRKDYVARTVSNAIINCKEVHESRMEKSGLDLLFIVNDKGNKVFIQNTENITRVLNGHHEFAGKFRYDSFKGSYEYMPKETWRTLEDNDAVILQTRISILFPAFTRVGKEMVYDAIIKVSKENTIDSASDYITGLKWDKTARLNSWLHHTYGVAEDKYHASVASNWLKGLVKRIIQPGSKFDHVMVLEGPQGSRKSTSLAVLGGDWHVETAMSTESKDFFMQMQGKAIVEFSEGETLNRTDVKRMKAIITMQSDKYRPPYERTSQDFPRRCVFAMTTNEEQYLKDESGNRRWLPVKLVFEEANIEWLKKNRDQLFAEAYHRLFVKNETVYEFPKEEMEREQQARRVTDPNADIVAHWYYELLSDEQRADGITVHQVFSQALGNVLGGKGIKKWQEMEITEVLKTHLNLRKEQITAHGVRTNRWFSKEPILIKSKTEVTETEDLLNGLGW